MDPLAPKSVAFSDKVIAVSPPESVCSVASRGKPAAACPKKSVSGVIFTLVILMFGLSIMYLISRIIAMQRKLSKLEQAQRNNSYDLADVVEEKVNERFEVQRAANSAPTVVSRVTPFFPPAPSSKVPNVPLPGRASKPVTPPAASAPPSTPPPAPVVSTAVAAASSRPPANETIFFDTPPRPFEGLQMFSIPMPPPHIFDLFLSEASAPSRNEESKSFVEEVSDGEASGTEVSKAVTSAMAPLADVVREMEKVADDKSGASSQSDESEDEKPSKPVNPKPTPAKRGRPRKKQT
jgi:hypothetical protein